MMTKRLSPVCRKQVKEALEIYRAEVDESDLAPDTKRTYLRHAETFVRWLHDDFVPGAGNRLCAFVLAIAVAVAVLAPMATSIAGAEEDAARIEKRFELRELARSIATKVEKRLDEAIMKSPTIQKEREQCDESYEERNSKITEGKEGWYKLWKKCEEEREGCWKPLRLDGDANAVAETIIKCMNINEQCQKKMMIDDWRLDMQLTDSRKQRDSCREYVIERNSEILDEMRKIFLEEEFDRLFEPDETKRRKDLKQAIRELSA